jgi:hypothetical protein
MVHRQVRERTIHTGLFDEVLSDMIADLDLIGVQIVLFAGEEVCAPPTADASC